MSDPEATYEGLVHFGHEELHDSLLNVERLKKAREPWGEDLRKSVLVEKADQRRERTLLREGFDYEPQRRFSREREGLPAARSSTIMWRQSGPSLDSSRRCRRSGGQVRAGHGRAPADPRIKAGQTSYEVYA